MTNFRLRSKIINYERCLIDKIRPKEVTTHFKTPFTIYKDKQTVTVYNMLHFYTYHFLDLAISSKTRYVFVF